MDGQGRNLRVELARRVEVPMIGLSYRLVVVGARSCLRTGGRRLEQPEASEPGVAGWGIRRGGRSISLCLQSLRLTLDSDPSYDISRVIGRLVHVVPVADLSQRVRNEVDPEAVPL